MPTQMLNVLITREGKWWVAQCLQIDIATQAATIDAVMEELHRVIAAHVAFHVEMDLNPFAAPPAPEHYWKCWSKGIGISPRPQPTLRAPSRMASEFSTSDVRIFA